MSKQEKNPPQINAESCENRYILCWTAFCLAGAALGCVFPLPPETFNFQIPDAFLNYSFPFAFLQNDFWIFLIFSIRYEVCFFLILTVLSRIRNHTLFLEGVFCLRGLFFGVGGMSIFQKTDFLCFFLVTLRQVLFISLSLCYTVFFCRNSDIKGSSRGICLSGILLCEFGVSLLIQFVFLFLISKI